MKRLAILMLMLVCSYGVWAGDNNGDDSKFLIEKVWEVTDGDEVVFTRYCRLDNMSSQEIFDRALAYVKAKQKAGDMSKIQTENNDRVISLGAYTGNLWGEDGVRIARGRLEYHFMINVVDNACRVVITLNRVKLHQHDQWKWIGSYYRDYDEACRLKGKLGSGYDYPNFVLVRDTKKLVEDSFAEFETAMKN